MVRRSNEHTRYISERREERERKRDVKVELLVIDCCFICPGVKKTHLRRNSDTNSPYWVYWETSCSGPPYVFSGLCENTSHAHLLTEVQQSFVGFLRKETCWHRRELTFGRGRWRKGCPEPFQIQTRPLASSHVNKQDCWKVIYSFI